MQPIFLANLTWPEVEALCARENRLLVVTGATEQHGPHLPLGTDGFIPELLAARLSARTGVPVAPMLPLGMSEAHMAFPGTFTLTTETLQAVYLETIQSAYRHGWRRLFVLNGHGGNRAALNWSTTLATKIKADLRIQVTHWWVEESIRTLVREHVGRNEGHAGLEESAAMLVAQPELVRLERARGEPEVSDDVWARPAAEVRTALPSGAIGQNPADATLALGEQMVAQLVEQYAALLAEGWA